MRLLAVLLLVLSALLSACSQQQEDQPVQVVERFFNAYENGDGDALVACLSTQALSDVSLYMEQLRQTPEQSSEYLNSIGISLTVQELADITAGEFITALLSSPVYAQELPDFSSVEFGNGRIYGNKALVPVTVDGNTEEIELILEDDEWKVVSNGLGVL